MYDPIEAAQSDSDFWESECKAERQKVRVLREALYKIYHDEFDSESQWHEWAEAALAKARGES